MWRALLIDDEAPARNHLRELLRAHPEVEILGEASCVTEAARLCASEKPNLLFLDLQMPRGSGFDLLSCINPVPEVIFVTAYNEYAVRAFEVGAVDYLLKPIFSDRLEIALKRLSLHSAQRPAGPAQQLSEDQPIFFRTDKGLRVVLMHHITHIVADGNYTTIWLDDGKSHLIDRSMNEWESILPGPKFLRLDRSLLVNVTHMVDLKNVSRNVAALRMTGRPDVVEIGRIARSRLRQLAHFR